MSVAIVTTARPILELAALFASKEFEGLLVAGVREPDPLTWVYDLRELYPRRALPIAILYSSEELTPSSIALAGKRFRETAASGNPGAHAAQRRILIDQPSRQVVVDRNAQSCSPLEFRLLLFFLRHPGLVFSRKELLYRTQSRESAADPRLVDVLVTRLRGKIDLGTPGPSRFTAVRGLGYRFLPNGDLFVDGWTGGPFMAWPPRP